VPFSRALVADGRPPGIDAAVGLRIHGRSERLGLRLALRPVKCIPAKRVRVVRAIVLLCHLERVRIDERCQIRAAEDRVGRRRSRIEEILRLRTRRTGVGLVARIERRVRSADVAVRRQHVLSVG
jgi:hypothetical protein